MCKLEDDSLLRPRKSLTLREVLVVATLFLGIPSFLLAQSTSTIQGQITDASGGAIAGATVRTTNGDTGFNKTAVSANDGFYRVPDLLPGSYDVRVEASGFKIHVSRHLSVAGNAVVAVNVSMEVGEVTQTIDVSAEEPLVETQMTRISEVLPEQEVRSLPLQGRGVLNLSLLTPGVTGKAGAPGVYCCDVFSNFAAPRISAGGNEEKGQWFLDGITLRYSEGSTWGAAFSPNPDAIGEVRVSTHPDTAELGRISGPQVQMVSKGGTNNWHGTSHYTFQNNQLNARPFFSDTTPDSYYRLFGGTVGGPILKDRLFVFGAYEGLRSLVAGAFEARVETEQFRDLVIRTRPNSAAAKVYQTVPPLRYPTEGLQDLGTLLPGGGSSADPDGIPDVGLVAVDNPFTRAGNQFNLRLDYQFPNAKDRLFGSYWYTRPEWGSNVVRPKLFFEIYTKVQALNVVHTRSFTPNILNEARFGGNDIAFDVSYPQLAEVINIPYLFSDDGAVGISAPFENIYHSRVYQFADNLSVNRGRHAFKFGMDYRHSLLTAEWPQPPSWSFGTIFDFANDNPYFESRTLEVATGAPGRTHLPMYTGDFSLFFQNTWQIRPNLTLNYGLRWEVFFPVWLQDQKNFQPIISSDQVTNPTAIAQVVNREVDRLYSRDMNNFGPRLGLAWDPTKEGKLVVRAGFGMLYDEINTYVLYGVEDNPPQFFSANAGPELGTPIVYGLAKPGTRDFPINPSFRAPQLTPAGGIVGTKVNIAGTVSDLKAPLIYDFMGGVQYQLATDWLVQANYKYRRGTSELYRPRNINRFQGDLLDGIRDGFNPNFNSISVLTNRGRRLYHGLVTNVTKRFSQGFSLSGSYTYNYGKNNFALVQSGGGDFYYANETDAFNQDLDYARDDIPHVLTIHSLWELPILRNRSDWLGRILGGWQLNTIWLLQSGEPFVPVSTAAYLNGGDFNADGYRNDRPDRPTQSLPSSYSRGEWLAGPLKASQFPLPAPATPRPGNLPRDAFRLPGYANVDIAFIKEFGVWKESGKLQIRAETFNAFNRVNLSFIENSINNANFGFPTGAYQNRVLQFAVKFLF
ncbi:MAG: carboxypeptidase regulatory-like domain-containing protein [Acidobacteria bacterium]|nr:carboxypeptidase regulatory-like domain-containing protein [Acidobacteriota bacterium]MCI0721953.1 carboxypeptidase regulatory-like domain-containing protein [Acidobacteriota bacterium]